MEKTSLTILQLRNISIHQKTNIYHFCQEDILLAIYIYIYTQTHIYMYILVEECVKAQKAAIHSII